VSAKGQDVRDLAVAASKPESDGSVIASLRQAALPEEPLDAANQGRPSGRCFN
jgi:hypothetical protein